MKSDINNLFSPPQNFAGLASPYADFETAKALILPVPYDGTTEWHCGTREGPMAIINASPYLEFYDMELDQEIYKVGIHTLPAVQPVTSNPEDMIKSLYLIVKELVKEDKLLITLGGEHSLSLGPIKALKEKYDDLSVLQFDAHADLRDEYLGSKFNNACIMRRIIEYCPITQVGIRSMSIEERNFLKHRNMNPFGNSLQTYDASEIQQMVDSLSKTVYISIDLDVFDPSVMPAVGTPEPGGMGWSEILKILRAVATQRHIVGFDIMELCPKEGNSSCAFMAAKLIYKLIGYALLHK